MGYRNHPLYASWFAMHQRCTNQNDKRFRHYGGRGIKVCKRWDNFLVFLSDMGERPTGMSIERINNDGDYKPSNCKWGTPLEQSQNRTSVRRITFGGETLCMSEWARRLGIKPSGMHARLSRLPLSEALTVAISETSEQNDEPPTRQNPAYGEAMTQSLSAEEIAELLAYFGEHGELPHGVEEALLGMASRLVECDEAETYLIDSGLLGRGIIQWATEAGWPGPTSQAKGG